MDFFVLVGSRHSVRHFQSKAISDEHLMKIATAANLAPSAGNLQAFEMLIVLNKQMLRDLGSACHDQSWIGSAAAVFVFFTNAKLSSVKYGRRGKNLYSLQDATIACSYAQLAAHALGVGACWVGSFDESAVKSVCGVTSDDLVPVSVLVLGYMSRSSHQTGRRELTDIVRIVR
jgi:nitroreductase